MRNFEPGEIKTVTPEYRLVYEGELDRSNPLLRFLPEVAGQPTFSRESVLSLRERAIEWGLPKRKIWIEEREHIVTAWKVDHDSITEIVNVSTAELATDESSDKNSSR
jgi:hypothetical protein